MKLNAVETYKNLIRGQQLYATLLYSYLCSHVTHEYKLYLTKADKQVLSFVDRYGLQFPICGKD